MNSIVKYLRLRLDAKIAAQRSVFDRNGYRFKNNEYYNDFMNIINKSSYTIEDMNDLLLCYSDHELSLEEILDLVRNGNDIYYDKDTFGDLFRINDFLLYFLLSSNNENVVKEILKLFSTRDIAIYRDYAFADRCFLNHFDTFYDIYYNLCTILNCTDLELQKKRAICFMYYINESFYLDSLKHIGITFEDVERVISEYESTGKLLNASSLKGLFLNTLAVNERTFGNDALFNKVRDEYTKYVSKNANFKLSDFVNYYNETFNDDFSVFSYNSSENTLLDERMLLFILNAYGFNNFKMGDAGYGEYVEVFKSLGNIKTYLDKKDSEVVLKDANDYEMRKVVIEKYGHLIEELKKPFKYTYKYFIYTNVLEEHRDAFKSLVAWHYVYGKSFDRDIRKNSKSQKEETFKVLLEQCREDIMKDLFHSAEISKSYYALVNEYVGDKYISAKAWKAHINKMVDEQLIIIGVNHFNIIVQSLGTPGFSVKEYLENNGLSNIIYSIVSLLKQTKPDLVAIIDKVMEVYGNEVKAISEEKQKHEKEKRVLSCSEIVSRFLEKDYKNKKDFLEAEGLTEAQFDKILELIEQENFELFVRFMNKFNTLKSQRYAILMKTVDVVLAGLVNGVNDNGNVRAFNFLDYCLITKLPFDKFALLAVNSNKLNKTNIRAFRQFEKAVRSYSMVTNEYLFTEKHIVMLNGEHHEVTYEEKSLALAYLRKYNLSNYYVLYKLALQKVLNGQVTKESLGIVPVSDSVKLGKKIS